MLLIALALLPGFTVQLYTEYRLRQAREQEVLDTALRLASQAGATYGRLVDGARQLVTTLALLPAIQPGHEDECNRLLADLQQQFPDFDRIGVVDDLGRLPAAAIPAKSAAMRASPISAGLPPIMRFSIGLRSAPSGIPDLLQFGYPVYAAQHFAGIVFAEISLRALANYLRAGQPLPSRAALALFDVTGTVLMRLPDDPSYVGVKISADDSARMNAVPVGTLTARGVDGRMRIFGHVPLQLSPGERLTLGVGVDRATAFAEYRKASRSALLLIGIGAAVALIVAWVLARWFLLAPIRRLLAAAERWGGGDYTYRVTLRDQRNELGRLGFSLNHMAGTCRDLLRRKDLLFKEINHRIFNSLRVLSSAISLQRSRLASRGAREQRPHPPARDLHRPHPAAHLCRRSARGSAAGPLSHGFERRHVARAPAAAFEGSSENHRCRCCRAHRLDRAAGLGRGGGGDDDRPAPARRFRSSPDRHDA